VLVHSECKEYEVAAIVREHKDVVALDKVLHRRVRGRSEHGRVDDARLQRLLEHILQEPVFLSPAHSDRRRLNGPQSLRNTHTQSGQYHDEHLEMADQMLPV